MKEALDTAPQFLGGNAVGNMRLAHQRRLAKAFVDFIGEGGRGSVLDLHAASGKFSGTSACSLHALLIDSEDSTPSEKAVHDGKKSCHAHALMQKDMEKKIYLPYQDAEFDWVFCNSVVEQAGEPEQQHALLAELWRVARKGIFVTASNKRHPIEFNTGFPLLHWMPRNAWKTSLNWFGKDSVETDRLPRLLDAASLKQLAESLPGPRSFDIGHVRTAGIKAQFFLMVRKSDLQDHADIQK